MAGKKKATKYFMKNAPTDNDPVLKEFEEGDLSEVIRQGIKDGTAVWIEPKKRQQPTSIVLDPELVQKLREKGAKRGLGYQTMLKVIVHEHIDEY